MNKVLKIAISALVLLFIGVIGCLLTFRSSNEVVAVSETKKITNPNIQAIDISIGNAAVEIIPAKDNTTKVELTGKREPSSKQKLSATVNGDTLSIKLKEQQLKFFTLNFRSTELSLKVYVPEKSYKSIKVNCNNGLITAADLQADNFDATTDNGRIALDNIKSNEATIHSDNGMVVLNNVEGKLSGGTNNGKITLKTKSLDRPIQLESDNGIIHIQTETEPTNVTFDVHVDNGIVNILDKYSGSAVIGKGENSIKLSTDNGRITITK